MNKPQLRSIAIGFLGVLAVLGTLFFLTGVEGLLQELAAADTGDVVLVVVLVLGWLTAWGIGLHTVLRVLGADLSHTASFFVLNAAMFANNVTPFGQAGGEPITALLISSVTDVEYERGLAAIASVDSINFVPSVTLALVGAGYYTTKTSLDRRLWAVTGGVIALAVTVTGLGYLGWRNRTRIRSVLAAGVTRLGTGLATVLPKVSPPSREAVDSRIAHFVDSIERVATNPSGILTALTVSTIGWVFQMAALWLAFVAIGAQVPFVVTLFAVPVGALAAITPLPGGAGGIEAVLVGLLASLPGAGVGMETALAAVVIYRGAVYWVPVTIGGTVASIIGANAL